MSVTLTLIGTLANSGTLQRVITLCEQAELVVYEQPSLAQILDGDDAFYLDMAAPESGTATELESECSVLGLHARLPRFLLSVQREKLCNSLALLWSFSSSNLEEHRTEVGTAEDLVDLLQRPEGWAITRMASDNHLYVDLDSPLLFWLKPRQQCDVEEGETP